MSRSWSITLRLLFTTIAALGSLVLVACSPAALDSEMGANPSIMPGSPTASQVLPTETVSAVAEPTAEPAPPSDELKGEMSTWPVKPIASPPAELVTGKVVALVTVDLAQRLGIAEEEIKVRSIDAIEWPDASLGCPQPGMMYAQVVTPGYRVVLEVEGQVYEAHTDEGQSAVWCEEEVSAMEVPPVPGTIEPGLETLVEQAREDLALRLSVVPEQITVLEAKAVVWPDSSLGCPEPGMAYAEVLTPGYLILLSANNEEYEYHASRGTEVIYCENPSAPIPGTPDDT